MAVRKMEIVQAVVNRRRRFEPKGLDVRTVGGISYGQLSVPGEFLSSAAGISDKGTTFRKLNTCIRAV